MKKLKKKTLQERREKMLDKNDISKTTENANDGITLIALIITIIIIIIIASILVVQALNTNGITGKASEANFKSRMSQFKEQLSLHESEKRINGGTPNTTNAGDILQELIEAEVIDVDEEETITDEGINTVLPSIKNTEKNYILVYKSELYYVANQEKENYANEVKWCNDLGIPVLVYNATSGLTGIKVVNGSYQQVNGTYACTPDVKKGFVQGETRYLNAVGSNLVAGNWITNKPSDNWYDYGTQKWANIYVESNGKEAYYVWIPRYCYKVDDNERMDVKFINLDNEYKYLDGEHEVTVGWSTLQNDGYQIPDAFWWDSNNNGEKDEGEQIPGFWSAKYELAEGLEQRTVNYDLTISKRTNKYK